MTVQERFIRYCKINTQSDDESNTVPTTKNQFDLANLLKEEMIQIGVQDVILDEHCYLYGTLPSNLDEEVDTIGFIAHMDTAPDFSGENVNPRIIENYDGQDIPLNSEVTMKVEDFSQLKNFIGKDLIVTDGNTLLGADDKAGVAEIMQACEYLCQHPEIKHGTIKIGFTPDEEVGRGADYFDVEGFGCKYAYTMDGAEVNVVAPETFNAASAKVTIHGFSIHPGSAKGKMINASNVAFEFHSALPKDARPENTEGREGFNHLTDIKGDVETATLHYILRNHDREQLNQQKELLINTKNRINDEYGKNIVDIEIRDEYQNMVEILNEKPESVNVAKKAIESLGMNYETESVRGGTDGSRLTFMGLPCPNLGTGGGNYHGRYEYCCIQDMDVAVQLILKIIELVKEEKKI